MFTTKLSLTFTGSRFTGRFWLNMWAPFFLNFLFSNFPVLLKRSHCFKKNFILSGSCVMLTIKHVVSLLQKQF